MVPCKGNGREVNFAATCLVDFINELGHANVDIVIKSDNEPVMKSIFEQVAAARKAATRPEDPPVGSSQSNGSVENGVKVIEGYIRAIRLSIESRYKCKLPIDHYMVAWIANHAAFCVNRFEIAHDGRTAYQRVRGKPFSGIVCELGENVHALKCKRSPVPHRYKYDTRWFEGVFLGFKGLTNEFLIGTPDGVKAVRTIRRKPIQDRWDIEALNNFKGLPWKHKAGTKDESTDAIEYGPANQAIQDDRAGGALRSWGGQKAIFIAAVLNFFVPI